MHFIMEGIAMQMVVITKYLYVMICVQYSIIESFAG